MKKFLWLLLIFPALPAAGQAHEKEASYAGCIVLSAGKHVGQGAETAFCNVCNYWTNAVVPYEFDPVLPQAERSQMLDAMMRIEGIAFLNFVPRNGHSNFIFVKNSPAIYNFSSDIGMRGGKQEIAISSWNSPMVICHELMHALGFFHEQSRPDRDTYVQVNMANICPGFSDQYQVENTGATPNIPYDFNSIMHYEEYAFAKCKSGSDPCEDGCFFNLGGYLGKAIEVRPPFNNGTNLIGNRTQFSAIDSLMLRFTYPFPTDRFVNNASVGPGPYYGQTLYNALKSFTADPLVLGAIPPGSDVWFMPGAFDNAEGMYSKPMTLHAPFGGVVLR